MYGYEPFKCPYQDNGNVLCDKKTCSKCGWNPEVAKKRLDAIIQKMMEKESEA